MSHLLEPWAGLLNVTLAGAPCNATPPLTDSEMRREYQGCQNLPTALWYQKHGRTNWVRPTKTYPERTGADVLTPVVNFFHCLWLGWVWGWGSSVLQLQFTVLDTAVCLSYELSLLWMHTVSVGCPEHHVTSMCVYVFKCVSMSSAKGQSISRASTGFTLWSKYLFVSVQHISWAL